VGVFYDRRRHLRARDRCRVLVGREDHEVSEGKFSLIYSDPPWAFKSYGAQDPATSRAAKYQTMTVEEMYALPVNDWAADNSLLAMWVYDPMLPQALDLAQAWGFRFTTVLFRWLKTSDIPGQLRLFDMEEVMKMGTGYHTRGGGCEECWLFSRGNGLPVLRHDIRKEFFSPRREHSRKPDECAKWLVDLYGDVTRIEMFARTRRIGWSVFGNQTDKFITGGYDATQNQTEGEPILQLQVAPDAGAEAQG